MKKWVLVGLVAVALLGAACGSGTAGKATPRQTHDPVSTSATTEAQSSQQIFGALNINNDWQPSGGPVPGGTATPCVGIGSTQGVGEGSVIDIQTDPPSTHLYTFILPQGLTVSGSALSLPGKVVSDFGTSEICQFDLGVSGLPNASSYEVSVPLNDGSTLGPFKMPRYANGNQPPTEITLDPQTATTPTTLPAPQTILSQSGTGLFTTDTFTPAVTGSTIHWSYDCSGFSSSGGNFILTVLNSTGQPTILLNDAGPGRSDTTGVGPSTGDFGVPFRLQVNSECSWTITITSP